LVGTRGKKVEPTYERKNGLEVSLFTTKAKATKIKNNIQSVHDICGELEFLTIRSTVQILSEPINQCCSYITILQQQMETKLLGIYSALVHQISKCKYFSSINRFVAILDFIKSNVRCSQKYKYYRPIIDKDAKTSYINATNLRHPLIEQLITTEYIPNDIYLGREPLGILVYGANGIGKTALGKSVAVAVMMAQSGMFVAGNMTYYPYTQIITRLSGNDDLLRGKSSFIIEASEIRTIERNCNNFTLVLADELCRGTESSSGTLITVAIIELMLERGASFISSTHMHQLSELDIIKSFETSKRLKITHLTTTYDEQLDKLVFNRKLSNGPGSSNYGLEVCRSLGFSDSFIKRTNQLQKIIGNESIDFYSTKQSRYNSKIFIDTCALCKNTINLQTHHLEEQHTADDSGYIGNYHKNSSFNLVVLCKDCHYKLHTSNTTLTPKHTLRGVYLETPK